MSPGPAGIDKPAEDGVAVSIVEAAVAQSTGRNAYTITWDTPEPASSEVVYGEQVPLARTATGTSEDGLHHEVVLWGLAGGTWQVMVNASSETVRYRSEAIELSPVTPADLPVLDVTTAPTDEVTGYTVTVLVRNPDGLIAVLDRQGRYVWWQHVEDIAANRALYDAASRSVLWLANDGPDASVLWRCVLDGQPEQVATLPHTHHDLTPDPAGGWYVLAYDERDVETDEHDEHDDVTTVIGDQLLHVSPDGSEVKTVWTSWDEFPYTGQSMSDGQVAEYPHTNSVTVDRSTGNVLLSLYLADALAMVDPETGLTVWTMGERDSDWTFPEGEAFAHQHSPQLLDDGLRLAIFDNGAGDPADPAEAALYDLDWDTFTATRAWSYDQGGVHTSITTGSAIPVGDAGSVLVAWGSDAALTQVSAAGEVEWQVEWQGDSFGYTSHIAEL